MFGSRWDPICHAVVSRDGVYAICGLPPGRYKAVATAKGFRVSCPVDFTLAEGQPQEIDFRLRPDPLSMKGSIYGTVVDSREGHALSGATVKAIQIDRGERRELETLTNGFGQYLLCPLEPGSYLVEAAMSGYRKSPPVTAAVSAGEHSCVSVSLSPLSASGTVSGLVPFHDDEEGLLVAALYRVFDDREELVQVKTVAPGGLYLFTGVDPGSYRVKAKGVLVGSHEVR